MFREFQLINDYFKKISPPGADVVAGIGDDAAVIQPPPHECLLVSTDTLVEGTHFFCGASPHSIGHKSVAVNLSDITAMGGVPRWLTASLTLPTVDESWVQDFCKGFSDLAQAHQVALVGGDLSAGPLSVTVHVMGTARRESVLYRHGAQAGDKIYVTGDLGRAAGAVWLKKKKQRVPVALQRALDYPVPQVMWGKVLGGVAHSAIDVSDGLLAEVGHIMQASKKSVHLFYEALPVSTALQAAVGKREAYHLALTGGDDYQLCFTVAKERENWLQHQATVLDVQVTCIGEVEEGVGVRLLDGQGKAMALPEKAGYVHW